MIITSRKNDNVVLFRLLCSDRKARYEHRKFPLEGVRLCMEAVAENVPMPLAFVTLDAAEKYPQAYEKLLSYAGDTIMVSDGIGDYMSDTKSPQGFFAVGEILDKCLTADKISSDGKFVLLESLQDPGNLGTIIRTADAMGISGIIMSPDCVDAYSPKVVRSSMGSLFRLSIFTAEMTDIIEMLKSKGVTVYASVVDSSAKKLTECDFNSAAAIVIGNEGAGVTIPTRYASDEGITIPMSGHAESLNAAMAAGVFMWEMTK